MVGSYSEHHDPTEFLLLMLDVGIKSLSGIRKSNICCWFGSSEKYLKKLISLSFFFRL